MANQNTVTWKIQNGTDIVSSNKTYSYEGQNNLVDVAITVANDVNHVWTADVSQIKALFIHSTCALTIETNSSSSPANTITLVADVPYIWTEHSYNSNLLTTDVTSLYLSSAATGTLNIRMSYDTTP